MGVRKLFAATCTLRRWESSGLAPEKFLNFVLQSNALPRKVSPMSIRTEAEENLRIIRSLMEKATVYRAISAPGALVAGIGAVAVAIGGWWLSHPSLSVPSPQFRFVVPWLGLLVIVGVVNLALLARDAGRRGEPFVSSGMRLALRAMLPAMLGGGVVALPFSSAPALVASLWVLFYGIGLLAASHFAPKSICWLGRAFFAAGFLLFASMWLDALWLRVSDFALAGHFIMGATFGLFHLIYAGCTWPRGGAVRSEA